MWFVEFAGKTVTSPASHCLLRAYVIRDGAAADAGVWLLRAAMTENIVEMGYVSYSRG